MASAVLCPGKAYVMLNECLLDGASTCVRFSEIEIRKVVSRGMNGETGYPSQFLCCSLLYIHSSALQARALFLFLSCVCLDVILPLAGFASLRLSGRSQLKKHERSCFRHPLDFREKEEEEGDRGRGALYSTLSMGQNSFLLLSHSFDDPPKKIPPICHAYVGSGRRERERRDQQEKKMRRSDSSQCLCFKH